MEALFAVFGIGILGIILFCILVFFRTILVFYAWNYVMPVLFSLPEITFWQSFALCIVFASLIQSHLNVTKKE